MTRQSCGCESIGAWPEIISTTLFLVRSLTWAFPCRANCSAVAGLGGDGAAPGVETAAGGSAANAAEETACGCEIRVGDAGAGGTVAADSWRSGPGLRGRVG